MTVAAEIISAHHALSEISMGINVHILGHELGTKPRIEILIHTDSSTNT